MPSITGCVCLDIVAGGGESHSGHHFSSKELPSNV